MKQPTKEQVADRMIKVMKEAGLTAGQMLDVIRLARKMYKKKLAGKE